MEIFALIGRKLSHSFSPNFFQRKFKDLNIDAEYRLFEMDSIEELHSLLDGTPDLVGFNVTIPFKKEILNHLDNIDDVARTVGSVNTVKISRINNKIELIGYNTDVIGFELSLRPLISENKVQRALILGTGGSAQAVSYVLKNMQIRNSK